MANVSAISGLSPIRYLNGAPWNGAANVYCVLSTDTNQYLIGDPVTTIGNAGADTFGVPAVTLASAGAATRGVIVGIGTQRFGPMVDPNNLSLIVAPATKASNYYVMVVDDPNVIYEIQEGGVGSVLTSASVNRNVNFNTGTRPVTGTTLSPAYLDNNTVNTTSTLNLKIISAIQSLDNAPYTQYQKWAVLINNHEFRTGTTSP